MIDCDTIQVYQNEIVIVLTFDNFKVKPDKPPTYTVCTSTNVEYNNGNLNLIGHKEIGNVKIRFLIDPRYKNSVADYIRFKVEDDTKPTFYALYSSNSNDLYQTTPDDFSKKKNGNYSGSQFLCTTDYGCLSNRDRSKIEVTYDNSILTSSYTSYGFKYETRNYPAGTTWDTRWTPDPGIKNGGVSLSAPVVAALAAIAALLGAGLFLVGRFLRLRAGSRPELPRG